MTRIIWNIAVIVLFWIEVFFYSGILKILLHVSFYMVISSCFRIDGFAPLLRTSTF